MGEADRADGQYDSGATTMPPKLAPLSASEIARPRLRVNQRATSTGIVTSPRPSQPNDIVRYAA